MEISERIDGGQTAARSRSVALRPLRVLEMLAAAGEPMPVVAIAGQLGVDRSTAFRILSSLKAEGYVVRDDGGTRYFLGRKLVGLASAVLSRDDGHAKISAALAALAEATGETVHFLVRDEQGAMLLQSSKGRQRLAVDIGIGMHVPLHASAAGKVLLAWSDPSVMEEVVAAGLPAVTRQTLVTREALVQELAQVRADGFATDRQEFSDDLLCVSVPVFGRRGRLEGAISFAGPPSRFTQAYLDRLREAAQSSADGLAGTL